MCYTSAALPHLHKHTGERAYAGPLHDSPPAGPAHHARRPVLADRLPCSGCGPSARPHCGAAGLSRERAALLHGCAMRRCVLQPHMRAVSLDESRRVLWGALCAAVAACGRLWSKASPPPMRGVPPYVLLCNQAAQLVCLHTPPSAAPIHSGRGGPAAVLALLALPLLAAGDPATFAEAADPSSAPLPACRSALAALGPRGVPG